jgi:hypothetical protein
MTSDINNTVIKLPNADVIWDNQKQNLIKKKLENIQLDAARIVTGGDQINIT